MGIEVGLEDSKGLSVSDVQSLGAALEKTRVGPWGWKWMDGWKVGGRDRGGEVERKSRWMKGMEGARRRLMGRELS